MDTRRPAGLLPSRAAFLFMVLLTGFAAQARADVTYTYIGHPFTIFGGSYQCPPVCRIAGSFTVAQALPANLGKNPGFAVIVPTSFTFTDGFLVFSSSAASGFSSRFFITTDGNGNIDNWDIRFAVPNNLTSSPTAILE